MFDSGCVFAVPGRVALNCIYEVGGNIEYRGLRKEGRREMGDKGKRRIHSLCPFFSFTQPRAESSHRERLSAIWGRSGTTRVLEAIRRYSQQNYRKKAENLKTEAVASHENGVCTEADPETQKRGKGDHPGNRTQAKIRGVS